jgi:pterin-4a-carbinolamine dehydratase
MSKASTHVPSDVCEHIFEYIPGTSTKTLLVLSLVSKQWQVIRTHDKLWKKIYYNRYSTNYKFAYIQIRKTLVQHPELFNTHQSVLTKLDVTVTGDGGVGKSSLCIHFCHNLFLYDIDPTMYCFISHSHNFVEKTVTENR